MRWLAEMIIRSLCDIGLSLLLLGYATNDRVVTGWNPEGHKKTGKVLCYSFWRNERRLTFPHLENMVSVIIVRLDIFVLDTKKLLRLFF